MKSIQTKFIALILGCVLLSSCVIGGAGIMKSKQVVEADSAQIMNLTCGEKANEINGLLSRIEQSVETLAVYTLDQLESVDKLKNDPAYLNTYTEELKSVANNAVNNTEGALAVYIRFNPEYTPPTSGLFFSKTDLNGKFIENIPTDLSSYEPSDTEHVGWYYIPVEKGEAVWMEPYMNKNINEDMISYVIPLYRSNEVVGVVGMDINYNMLTENISTMRIYDSGYAFLADAQGTVMYHKELKLGSAMEEQDESLAPLSNTLKAETSGSTLFKYVYKGQKKAMAFRNLSNGMRLVLTAPKNEIDSAKNELIMQIIIACIIISAISLLLTILMARRIIRPLRELNIAAKKIASGDLSISIFHQTKDEVGMLADSFQQTVNHLQKYIDYINGLAYRDALTGIKNKTAYQDAVQRLEEQMRLGRPNFAVIVFDINGLKQVNDTHGHDFGDMLIVDACKLICMTFKHSPVYRIGGDEFVALLQNGELEHYADRLDEFSSKTEEFNRSTNQEFKVSIARGIAIYNYESDIIYANVFKRADDAMYQNKIAMKQHLRDEKIETENNPNK